jgi:hypothetical protein
MFAGWVKKSSRSRFSKSIRWTCEKRGAEWAVVGVRRASTAVAEVELSNEAPLKKTASKSIVINRRIRAAWS